jgi:hypothetical protein
VFDRLMATPGDIVAAVDGDWTAYYEGRTHHPVGEAENALYDAAGTIVQIGKRVDPSRPGGCSVGEFLGLWRMTAAGTRRFLDEFDRADARLEASDTFHGAARWIESYIADMLQELVDRGAPVTAALVERGWAELDTEEDYERLPRIAARQRLHLLKTILADA